ncbi:hypothetical protein [Halobacillus andaensis]|uniref:hypothetical protein n=1 Tax=Halobacillus andaensis TaxID=1176239 RepID=UPI003D70FF94
MKEKIFLYYTSDLHSHFENWAQIVGYFNQKKRSIFTEMKRIGFLTMGIMLIDFIRLLKD